MTSKCTLGIAVRMSGESSEPANWRPRLASVRKIRRISAAASRSPRFPSRPRFPPPRPLPVVAEAMFRRIAAGGPLVEAVAGDGDDELEAFAVAGFILTPEEWAELDEESRALLLEVTHGLVVAPHRPVMLRNHHVGLAAKALERIAQVLRPALRVAHLGAAQRVQIGDR